MNHIFGSINHTVDERDSDFSHRIGYASGLFSSGPSYPFMRYSEPTVDDKPGEISSSDQLLAFSDSGLSTPMAVTWEIRCANGVPCKAGKTPWIDADGYLYVPGIEQDYKRAYYILRVRSVDDPSRYKDVLLFPMRVPT